MLSLRIALRYLFSHKSHSAVNIISMISVAGVVVATAAIVIIMSVFNGFGDLAATHVTRLDPDYMVTRRDGRPIAGAAALADSIRTHVGGVTDVTVAYSSHAFAIIGDSQAPVTAIGLTDSDLRHIGLDSLIVSGTARLDYDGTPCALLSAGAAVALDSRAATPELRVLLYEPRRTGRVNPGNPMGSFRADTLIYSGIYMTGDADLDASAIIVPAATMRRLLEYDTEGDMLRVYTASGSGVTAGDIAAALPGGTGTYTVADRIQQHAAAWRMISVEKWMTFVLLAFVLVIASFNIISTMAMLIIEKRPNAAILGALGATPAMTTRIYVWQSILVTGAGGLLGIILGVALSLAQQYGGFITLQTSDPTILTVDAYPVAVHAADILLVAVLITLIALLTSAVTIRALRR